MDRPIVGVNAELLRRKRGKARFAVLSTAYGEALTKAGARPVILPAGVSIAAMPLDVLDGIVLSGSDYDYDPRTDGWHLHASTRPMAPERDESDRQLARWIVEHRTPVLGIGGGMQLLNLACGGTLALDIASEWPRALRHRDDYDPSHRHALTTEPGSMVDRAYREHWGCVTSQHHQAVDDVAAGFVVTARSPDGVIEAIESTDPDWLAIGVQWHPEAEAASAVDRLLFREWVAEVARRRSAGDAALDAAPGPPMLRSRDASARLGVSRETLRAMRVAGTGPAGAWQDTRGWWWYPEDGVAAYIEAMRRGVA
jgi:putative glutamine amidotransferase